MRRNPPELRALRLAPTIRGMDCDNEVREESTEVLIGAWETWQTASGLSCWTIRERSRLVRRLTEKSGRPAAVTSAADLADYLAAVPPGSRATYWASLRAWYRWLVLTGRRRDNPTDLLPQPKRRKGAPRPVADEYMAVLLAGAHMYHHTHVMILLAALAGLRVHEVAKIHGRDVDTIARTITVVGKGDTIAVLPMHPMLTEQAQTMPSDDWWFLARRGREGHVHGRSVSTLIGNAMRRNGVPGTPHALRHWYATTLLSNGADLRVVQELMRHSSVATTQIYTRVTQETMRAAVGRLAWAA